MVFCHGCGNSIHETAITCPRCGAPQKAVATTATAAASPDQWASITAFVVGIIDLILIMSEPDGSWDSDTVVGGVIFGIIPIIFGVISLSGKQQGQWMAITGLILGILTVLVSFGSL